MQLNTWPKGWRPVELLEELEQFARLHTATPFALNLAELLISSHFGQVATCRRREWVAWLRWPMGMESRLEAGEIPLHMIQASGPVIQVVSLYAPARGLRAVHWLSRLEGAKVLCGRSGGKWRIATCRG